VTVAERSELFLQEEQLEPSVPLFVVYGPAALAFAASPFLGLTEMPAASSAAAANLFRQRHLCAKLGQCCRLPHVALAGSCDTQPPPPLTGLGLGLVWMLRMQERVRVRVRVRMLARATGTPLPAHAQLVMVVLPRLRVSAASSTDVPTIAARSILLDLAANDN
jgi:hypothetical protein